jgi:hypothetical protein
VAREDYHDPIWSFEETKESWRALIESLEQTDCAQNPRLGSISAMGIYQQPSERGSPNLSAFIDLPLIRRLTCRTRYNGIGPRHRSQLAKHLIHSGKTYILTSRSHMHLRGFENSDDQGAPLRPLSLIGLALLLLSCLVMAQSSDPPQASDRVEVFGGYTYVKPDFSLVNRNGGVSGWDAAVNFKMRPWIGIVADVSGLYPRYTFRSSMARRPSPQAEMLTRICLAHRSRCHRDVSGPSRTSWLGRATYRTKIWETRGAHRTFSRTMLSVSRQAAALTTL